LRAFGALRRERAVLAAERVEDSARVGIAEIALIARVGLVGKRSTSIQRSCSRVYCAAASVARMVWTSDATSAWNCGQLRVPRDLDPTAAIPVVDDDLAEQDVPSGVDPDRAAEHDRRPHHHLVVRLAGADRVDEARRTRRRRIGHAEQLEDRRKRSAPDTGPGTVTLAGSTPTAA
jgi:hypothetical protein